MIVCTFGVVYLLAAKKQHREAPLKRAGSHSLSFLEDTETRRKNMPSARRRHFCLLLLPGKSMASGGTRTASFGVRFYEDMGVILRTQCGTIMSL